MRAMRLPTVEMLTIIKNPLFWLLLVTFFQGVITTIVVPMWEFPDEQVHMAQVVHYIEEDLDLSGQNVSEELYLAQEIMGTVRDEQGNNLYTYNPNFKPQYSQSLFGPREKELSQVGLSTRKKMVLREAAGYPPLYYLLTGLGYQLTYSADLFTRLFAVRLVNILMAVVSVFFTYKIGRLLFEQKLKALVLASLLAFHPMWSFLSSGVNNDNLMNLASILIIFFTFKLISAPRKQDILAYFFALGIGFLTKPLITPLVLLSLMVVLFNLLKTRHKLNRLHKNFLFLLVISSLVFGVFVIWPMVKTGRIYYLELSDIPSTFSRLSLLDYLSAQLSQYYRETLVWFWGVFKWLGVILPLHVIRAIKLWMLISGVGLGVILLSKNKPVKVKIFTSIFLSLGFIFLVTLWDYWFVASNGYSHGLQGRYFFPVLIPILHLLLSGYLAWWPRRFEVISLFGLLFSFWIIKLISWLRLTEVYYQLDPLNQLWLQMSQYKPWFIKMPFMYFWFGIYLLVLILFFTTIKLSTNKNNK